jgi:hypothetical protein
VRLRLVLACPSFEWTTTAGWRFNLVVIDLGQFKNLRLHGGFVIREIEVTEAPITDALGRQAVAQTRGIALDFRLLIGAGLSEEELSITLYHEILEAASVAIAEPPASVTDFNEADFERAAHEAHVRWGNASPANLNRLLQFHGFRGR